MSRLVAALVFLCAACASGAGPEPANPSPSSGGREQPAAPAEGATTEREGRGKAVLLAPAPHASIVVRRTDTVAMELPAGTQVQSLERTAYITAIAERNGDEHRMTFVLDSILASAGSFLPADSLAAATGARWTARLLADGRLLDLTLDTVRGRPRSSVADQTTRIIEVLYPTLPAEGARAGATWSDSVATHIETGGVDVNERGVVRYTASQLAGGALEIVGEGVFQQKGSGMQFGQELEMSGEGRRRIAYRLDESGRLLGATGTDGATLEIIVPALGQTVPLTQNSRFDVTFAAR